MEVAIGETVILLKDNTLVDGEITGWLVAGGELVHIFIKGIESPFKMFGEDPWKVVTGEEEENEIQP